MTISQEQRKLYEERYKSSHPNWRELHNEARKKRKLKYPEAWLLSKAKERVVQKGFDCDIELSDIFIPDICPITGEKLFFSGGKENKNTPSLDRIDNSKGYIKGNVRVISSNANRLKSNITIKQVERLLAYMKGEL